VPKLRRVALIVETSRAFGRGVIRGVAQYSRERGPWSIYFTPHGLDDPPPGWLQGWSGDGILARIEDPRMAEAVRRTGAPVVELRGMLPDLGFPHIGVDNQAVVQTAVDHLFHRGLRQFAFLGYPRGGYPRMDEREDCFVRTMHDLGLPFSVFDRWPKRPRPHDWERQQSHIAQWIAALAKPVGILGCSDDCGLQVLDACRRAGVSVPEQAAVVGVDNDEYLCMLSIPPLTSVDIAPQHIGYEAAALLDRMMAGAAPTELRIRTPPGEVVVRESSDLLATQDEAVVAAVKFIRAHACDRIKVADVARGVGLSPTALETRMRRVIGRTVYQEIQRVQIDAVRELLGETDLPLKQIARRCGFKYTQYLSRVFRQSTGRTLTEYRKQMRL
jgi:LacI family transcriptional regulator